MWKILFFLEFLQFHIFLTSRETVLVFFAKKIINRFVRSVFCVSGGNFQEHHFSWEALYLLVSFGLSAMVFRTFAKKTSVKSVKTAFNVWAEKVRRETFTFGKITTFFCRTFVDCFSMGFSKLAATCPEETSEGIYLNSFSFKFGLERKNIELLFIKLCHCSQNSIQ